MDHPFGQGWREVDAGRLPGSRATRIAAIRLGTRVQVPGVPKITALKIGIPLPVLNAPSSPMVAVDIRRPDPIRWRINHAPSADPLATTFSAHARSCPVGLSARTLEKHRSYGTGPRYRKVGGRIIYALSDLRAWADLGIKRSTSDPGLGTVLPAKPILAAGRSRPQTSSNGLRKADRHRSSSLQLIARSRANDCSHPCRARVGQGPH